MEIVSVVEEDLTPIHPALNFSDDMVSVAVPLPSKITVGDKNEVKSEKIVQRYWVVTSYRQFFELSFDNLIKKSFYQTGECYVMENLWNYCEGIKPWLEEKIVSDPARVYQEVKRQYEYYLDFTDSRLYDFFSLWTIGTYFFPLFQAYPIPFLHGPSGTGKSKTCDVTAQMAFNAINTANISDASIYRLIQGTRCTLIMDENERIASDEESHGMMNILLAGFKKGAKVIRLEKGTKKEYIPTKFEVHSPKILANIRGANEDALKNRCIWIIMMPPAKGSSKGDSYPSGDESQWTRIRSMLYILLMERWKGVIKARDEITPHHADLTGYPFLMWHPILSLARFFEPFLGSDAVWKSALYLAHEKTKERTKERQDNMTALVLKSLQNAYHSPKCLSDGKTDHKFIPTAVVADILVQDYGCNPEWIKPYRVGRIISGLGVGSADNVRVDHNPQRGYWVKESQLKDVMERHQVIDDESNV